MIVRPAGAGAVHLITQPDHAALAARIMRHWASLATAERREDILRAVHAHDIGWREPDAAPVVRPDSGAIADFLTVPVEVRQGVWPRALQRLADAPWTAALVAHHAVSVYDRFRADPAWTAWFAQMEALRDAQLARTAGTIEMLARDYVYVRLGDLASLAFCNAWSDPQSLGPWTIRLIDGRTLLVDPNPFAYDVAIDVDARRLAAGPYDSDAALQAAFAAAPVERIAGVVVGRTRTS
jgi:hypothetical protein